MVKKAVNETTLISLVNKCSSLGKTRGLTYKSMSPQNYLKVLYPNQCRIIFKCRCQTLNIKSQNSFMYEESDTMCRKCGAHEETFDHIINCGYETNEYININIQDLDNMSEIDILTLMIISTRIEAFCE